MNIGLKRVRQIKYRASLLYNLRMAIAFLGTAFIPYFLNFQIATIPLTLGVVAAGLSDIDDRFTVRIMNLAYTYLGFFIAASAIQLLFPYPIIFAISLLFACICWVLLGSLGRRYATISYGCLVVSVYSMLGVHLFDTWYIQPSLLVIGAIWYGILSTISYLIFPIQPVQEKLALSYSSLGNFLFAKANLFDVDMTDESYKQSWIDLSLENSKLIQLFNEMKISLLTRLKGDRGRKSTRRSLQYYFVAQDIHERADSSHIDYQVLVEYFKHSDIIFRFQRILSLQGKACKDLSDSIRHRTKYEHNIRFKQAFENLNLSLKQLRQDYPNDPMWVNALHSLYKNLKSIDSQLINLETEQAINIGTSQQESLLLKDDDLKGFSDIVLRIKQNFTPESVLFRHAIRIGIVLFFAYIFIQTTHITYGFWILLTALFVSQPNFNATKRRLRLRIIGTLMGVIVGFGILYFIPSTEGQLTLLVISGILFFELRSKQYAQATAFITILALINFNLDGGFGYSAALPRLLDTMIGCFFAWLGVTFIFPDWKFRRLPRNIKKAFQAQCDYLNEVVKQYHHGKSNSLDYRFTRRAAHNSDAELASVISTLATEPFYNASKKTQSFDLLCLNHTLLSYIAALGAHREKIEDPDILKLLDQALSDITGVLLHDEMPDLTVSNVLQNIRERLSQDDANDQLAIVILQQLSLMFGILGQLRTLKQSLSYEQDDSSAFASL
ncbi:YccS family putative transporter [Acinetobacter sp. ESL0695]|uniref:TIGR01666 family membrane protein n=2 Tax=Gammaproteobacteria TaxID=1236 RepID=A0ABU6DRS3_9GAMM|nr:MULTISPECIES: YccS family putative transporter [Acinetobacter]MEB5476551.1 TIGR01666 family membrane protein [Acinetobacter pollinis]WEV49420.1 YccS family putative transporter [Acinetobacter sp. ESL0695]